MQPNLTYCPYSCGSSKTINLVRDKLESKIIQLEENLRNNFIESFHKFDSDIELKKWIRSIESDNPTFKNLFLINAGGGLFSASVSLGLRFPDG